MSRVVIRNGTHMRYDHFGPAATPIIFNVELARAILNFGNRGSLTDNTTCPKAPDRGQAEAVDDFLLEDFAEFFSEEIAAPISNKDFRGPKFPSCDSTIRSNGVSFQGNNPETKSCNEPYINSLPETYNDIAPVLEWFSTFDEETYSLHGVSKCEEYAFLSSCEDQIFFPEYGAYGSLLDKNYSNSFTDGMNSTACHLDKRSLHSIDPMGVTPKEVSVPGRARSKRSRSGVGVRSSGILSTSSNMRNGSTCSISEFSDPSVASLDAADLYTDGGADESVANAQIEWKASSKSKKVQELGGQAKRCAHCLSQKTPQWRAGPTGPKTLCNACGVRYKAGRLFPEYRPAKSPTFLSHIHSNSHKKVLEIRREKMALPLVPVQGDEELIFKPAFLELDDYGILGERYIGPNSRATTIRP